MNIIEKFGSYENAKNAFETSKRAKDFFQADIINHALKEYRRENNIFEHGDKIVYIDRSEPSHLYTVKNINDRGYDYGNDWGWYGVSSNMGVGYTFKHAGKEEIKAGRRL